MKKHLFNQTGNFLPVLLAFTLTITAAFGLLRSEVLADGSITIISQPESVEVSYPDGASFFVKVDNPDNVAAYQWEIADADAFGIYWQPLDGPTAVTDTYILPSTQQDVHDQYLRCAITDKEGNTVYSDTADLIINNRSENKSVLYVVDYAVEPGETLNVADTGYGTGTVSFDADGVNMTLDNVNIRGDQPISGPLMTASMGVYLMRHEPDHLEYYLNIIGDCVVENNYYDADYNNTGVTIGAYLGLSHSQDVCSLIITGDGTLTIDGGNSIWTNSNLVFDTDVIALTNGDYYSDSIWGNTIVFNEGVSVKVAANGTGIHAGGDIRISKGANIEVTAYAPHVSVGATVKQAIFLVGSLYAEDATVKITAGAKTINFIPYNSGVGMLAGISVVGTGSINLSNTDMTINMEVEESGGDPYVYNMYGITCGEMQNSIVLSNNSTLKINSDNTDVYSSAAIAIGGRFIAEKGTRTEINFSNMGETIGLEANDHIEVTDATIEVVLDSKSGDHTYGIVGDSINITLTDSNNHIHSIAPNGVALAASTGELSETEYPFTPDYTPTKIILSKDVKIMEPKKSDISTFGVPGMGEYIIAETVFDTSDTTTPATEVTIAIPQQSPLLSGLYVLAIAVFLYGAFSFFKKRNKKEDA